MSITLDIIEGHNATLDADGLKLTRIAKITGLTGTAAEKIVRALDYPGMPQRLDEHPAKSSCRLRSINVDAVDSDSVTCTLNYAESTVSSSSSGGYPELGQPPVVEVGTSVSQVTSNKDVDGNDIVVSYVYPATYVTSSGEKPFKDLSEADRTVTQSGEYSKFAPESAITYKTTEYVSPGNKSTIYAGKVNDGIWQGGEVGTWLCARISGFTDDAGLTYKCNYEFWYRSSGWNSDEAIFIDPNTGRPPADLVIDVGRKKIKSYLSSHFPDMFK